MKSTCIRISRWVCHFSLSLSLSLSLSHSHQSLPLRKELTIMYVVFLLSSIALWSTMKKKPLIVQPHHTPSDSEMSSSVSEEHWVTAVAAYFSTDLVASGMYMIAFALQLIIV